MLNQWFPNVDWEKMWEATRETLYMTGISTLATFILGIILGLLLFLTAKGNMWQNYLVNKVYKCYCKYFSFHSIYYTNCSSDSIYQIVIWYDDW